MDAMGMLPVQCVAKYAKWGQCLKGHGLVRDMSVPMQHNPQLGVASATENTGTTPLGLGGQGRGT